MGKAWGGGGGGSLVWGGGGGVIGLGRGGWELPLSLD